MGYFDLRYALPLLINFLNSQSSEPLPLFSDLLLSNPTPNWTRLCFLFVMLLLFSTTSMNIPITLPSPSHTTLIRFQFGNFSAHLTLSLVASLVLPRALFWYLYPAILISSLCFSSMLLLLRRFFGWLNNKLSALPVWNLLISSTLTHEHDGRRFEADTDIELQAPLPQVGDSDVEAHGEIMVL